MKKILYAFAGMMVMAAVACGNKGNANAVRGNEHKAEQLAGDKTIYGLACDGCNDTVVVILPEDGSDPVTYSIVEAEMNGRVLGKPKVGDRMALLLKPGSKREAELVLDLEQLKGIWCYIVMPKLRVPDGTTDEERQRLENELSDSLRNIYFIPREYGFSLKSNWIAQSVGYIRENASLRNNSPVEYPRLGYFTEWRIWNGKLVITSGTPSFKEGQSITIVDEQKDTCDIVLLQDDSLVLSSDGATRGYYRVEKDTDVNKRAKAIIEKLQKKALEETKN